MTTHQLGLVISLVVLAFRRLCVSDAGVVGAELTDPYAELLADNLMERLQDTLGSSSDSDPSHRKDIHSNRPWANREPDFVLSGRGSNYNFEG